MLRWSIALLLVVLSAALGHGLYRAFCPKVAEQHCTMQWLGTQLDLSAPQSQRIKAIHQKYWVEIKGKDAARKDCSSTQRPEKQAQCQAVTQKLIEAVCAELDERQKAKYLSLVAPCSKGGQGCR
jgi:hypothetical protein